MPIIRPAITGNNVQDSWADQMTRAINASAIGGSPIGAGDIGGGGAGAAGAPGMDAFNSATLYLYQRTETDDAPDRPDEVTRYTYSTAALIDEGGEDGITAPIANDWYRIIPETATQDGGFIWVTTVNIAEDETETEIPTDSWSSVVLLSRSLEDAPIPRTITGITIAQTSESVATISWSVNIVDLNVGGYKTRVERFDGTSWFTVAEVTPIENALGTAGIGTYIITDVENIVTPTLFRLTGVNFVGTQGAVSATQTFAPPTPSDVDNLRFVRDSASTATLSWDFIPSNFVRIKYFVIEYREGTTGDFSQFAVADLADGVPIDPATPSLGNTYNIRLSGLDTDSLTRTYRVFAVTLQDIPGATSAEITPDLPTVERPIGLVANTVERVGVITSVDLTWTRPIQAIDENGIPLVDSNGDPIPLLNTLVTATIQFRPITTPETPWTDVQTVSAATEEAESQPPQQGFVQYRIRYTAINGRASAFVESPSIFVSGGSATDDAIFGADGDYVSQPHYSVNSDDFELDTIGRISSADVRGGTYDTTNGRIEGINGQQLEVDWIIDISDNMVNRRRHFYLDLGTSVSAIGNRAPNWTLGSGNIFVEILSASNASALMYLDRNTPSDPTDAADVDFVYTDATGASVVNTRSFVERENRFMYASREFLRLPMQRTFTFRDPAPVIIRLRFTESDTAHPRIDFGVASPTFTPATFQAFSTEVQVTQSFDNVDVNGVLWEFGDNRQGLTQFEAPPMVLITPSGPQMAYFTSKTNEQVMLHTDAPAGSGITVDATARGR